MTRRNRQQGLSLIELMVSITLGLMILSGVLVVFVNSSAARQEVERTSRQIENGRYASEILSEDIRLAGFLGELDVGQIIATVGAPAALPADPCSVSPGDWASWIPLHMQGYDEAAFVSAVPGCVFTNRKADTDVLVVRRARACRAGLDGCEAAVNGKPYLQVSLCEPEPTNPNVTYRLGLEGATAFDRHKKSCAAAADKREYLVRIYFVSTDNGAGQNIPTLKRLELTGAGWSSVPLVEGIEELQLEYGLDTDGDGVPNVYVADPNTYKDPPGPCNAACQVSNWMSVVTVQFYVLARNLEPSLNYTDAKRYELGKNAAGAVIQRAPGDRFRRHVYSGLVRVVNASGRKDKP